MYPLADRAPWLVRVVVAKEARDARRTHERPLRRVRERGTHERWS